MRTITAIISVFVVLVTPIPIYAQPGMASPQCVQCRNACFDARVACQSLVCQRNGGQDAGPNACFDVTNTEGFTQGVQLCVKQETACWGRCAATVAGCR
jgi:hypothetical protein